ncbi:proline dehydrogenase family protein [Armatimonas sp.]|uniref:proline dehydrogenase family protein n=1 Tax=Armatimonas sp. TaxID=1872638 RepID=UPI003750D3C2
MSTTSGVELATLSRGKRLLSEVRRQEKKGSFTEIFYSRLMALSTRDEKLKIELFRFVDALPALKSPESVARHLLEYLVRPDVSLPPGGAQLLMGLASTGPSRSLLHFASHTGARLMAGRFIAGRDGVEAVKEIERLRRVPMTFTMDLLGEAVTSEVEALAYQKKYLDLIEDLARLSQAWPGIDQLEKASYGPLPKVNVSVKLSSLYSRFDPMAADATVKAVKERLHPILSAAKNHGLFVNFDMEQHDFCTVTNRIFREIFTQPEFADWADVGIVVQAYLKRAEADLIELRNWVIARGVPVHVRLVKGAYWDFETIIAAQRHHPVPVWEKKTLTDACFERCTEFLLDNWQHLRPAIASHNVRSSSKAQALAEAKGVPPRTVEYQVLFGMGEPIGRALAAQGERVRTYVPFGELLPGMAYLVRRLLENSSNDSFIRKSGDQSADDALLAEPNSSALPPPAERGSDAVFVNNPEVDFAIPENQEKMQDALDQIQSALGFTVPIVINGKREESAKVIERRDPSATAVIVSKAHFASVAQADAALAAASAAFPSWRDTSTKERAELLRRTAEQFEKRRFEISAWMVREVGKPWREADGDVAEAIDFCNFYAAEMERLSEPRKRNLPGEWNEYFYDARGPAVIIAPWNFPLAILCGMAVAAIVAGNPVILKPSEQACRVGYFLQEALEAAGCPAGVSNFLPGDGEEIGPTLVNDPRVAVIAFTGSKAVGLSIIRSASEVRAGQREIKRVIAELGGKNAIIVDEDADLDEAVAGALASVAGFAGQKCSACSRIIVIGDAYEPFCHRLGEAMASLIVGNAADPATNVPPVVDADSQARIERYIEIGKQEGTLIGQKAVPPELIGTGYYVAPSAFIDCPADGKLCQEEVFGPVVAILKAATLDEALAIADGTIYALTGGLYSRSPKNIERVRREFRVGNLYINRKITGAVVDRQPFGGARMSGVGSKAGGPDYLQQFLVPRTITESVMRRGFAPTEEG